MERFIYIPLYFDTNLSYDHLCDKIANADCTYNKKYQNEINNKLDKMIFPIVDDYMNCTKYEDLAPIRLHNFSEHHEEILTEDEIKEIKEQGLRIEVDQTHKSIMLYPTTEELESLRMRSYINNREFNTSKEIYSVQFTNSHNRFLLLPLVIKLNSNEIVRLHALLYVFKNNMGVLKLELPLKNVNVDPLLNNHLDDYISNISCTWKKDINPETPLFALSNFYLKALSLDKYTVVLNDVIKNIILIDYQEMPKAVNSLSSGAIESLYRILLSPFNVESFEPYRSEARNYINDHSWGSDLCRYIFNEISTCVSFIDIRTLDGFCQGIDKVDSYDREKNYNEISADLNVNVELAILVIMLKKINNSFSLSQKLELNHKGDEINEHILSEIQNKYCENNIFISNLQEYCYGSVSELIDFVELNMKLYLKQDLADMKLKSIDDILLRKHNIRELQFQHFISFCGIFFTLIFGLPSIFETLNLLRNKLFTFLIIDIPFLSVGNLSVILWLLLFWMILRKKY